MWTATVEPELEARRDEKLMKNPIKSPTLKDMRTTLNVLSSLSVDVPDAVFIELSNLIQEKEEKRFRRKVNRMSEEELIRFSSRQKKSLRILLSDGRLLHAKTNNATFVLALQEVGAERLQDADLKMGRKPLFLFTSTHNKSLYKNYLIVSQNVLVYAKTTAEDKRRILMQLDERYELNWQISIV